MNKLSTKIGLLFLSVLILFCILPINTLALDIDKYSDIIAERGGYQTGGDVETFFDTFIGRVIAYVLGFVGIIFLILIIISGFQWMTAGGNEEKVGIARKRIVSAVIGLFIILAAYLITYFVYTTIKTASEGGTPANLQEGFECQYNTDCTDPSEPYCQHFPTWSFCARCTEDSHCGPGEQCCTSLTSNWCAGSCN
ncbi:hypothetical protein KKF32_03685 [Patescibacteria group bacterium]|nr:hypothetical protein [Patescibacteria group bacterium]